MGMFSWECSGCHKSLLSETGAEDHPDVAWRKMVVALLPNGEQIIGEYDGYGRVTGTARQPFDIVQEGFMSTIECYHYRCWQHAGQPGYSKPSPNAEDQGFMLQDDDGNWID